MQFTPLAYGRTKSQGLAETVLSATAWGYYRSAGDDEKSQFPYFLSFCHLSHVETQGSIASLAFDENREAFSRFWFRPRVQVI